MQVCLLFYDKYVFEFTLPFLPLPKVTSSQYALKIASSSHFPLLITDNIRINSLKVVTVNRNYKHFISGNFS